MKKKSEENTQKELNAVIALFDEEVSEYGHEPKITHSYNNEFDVFFEEDCTSFKDLCIRVIELDEDDPGSSKFSVCVYEDLYEDFTNYDHTIKEFWKVLLWK